MKKFLMIMVVAAAFTACNDNTKTEESKRDSMSAPMTADSSAAMMDTSAMKMDTTASKMSDTTKPKM